MTHFRRSLLFILLAAPAAAQPIRARAVTIGDRIRVVAPESGYDVLKGRVESTYPDLIGMRVDGSPGLFYVKRAQIEEIEISIRQFRRTRRGLGVGTVLGGFGALWFGGKGQPVVATTSKDPGTPATTRALVGASVGAVLGAGIGFLYHSDEWATVSAAPSGSPLSNGRGTLGFSLRF